mmetsp:Transcript_5493/g.33952  ORF Transcript_5493/g.33952 Transcript_5493/m.33952 type:complete len:213 (-) Transcript_5493:1430-2068(-)
MALQRRDQQTRSEKKNRHLLSIPVSMPRTRKQSSPPILSGKPRSSTHAHHRRHESGIQWRTPGGLSKQRQSQEVLLGVDVRPTKARPIDAQSFDRRTNPRRTTSQRTREEEGQETHAPTREDGWNGKQTPSGTERQNVGASQKRTLPTKRTHGHPQRQQVHSQEEETPAHIVRPTARSSIPSPRLFQFGRGIKPRTSILPMMMDELKHDRDG